MPLPTGLVVKNGSNTLAMTSGGMPTPVSLDGDGDILAGGDRSRSSPSVTFCAVIVTVPPSGMASRALIDEIDQRDLEFADVDRDRPDIGGDLDRQPDVAAEPLVEHLADRLDALARRRSVAD